MALSVWKYQWPGLARDAAFEMPAGAQMLHVDAQSDHITIWARVDPNAPKRTRQFILCGTGHPAPDEMDARHIGTALTENGTYVWHVFECTKSHQ